MAGFDALIQEGLTLQRRGDAAGALRRFSRAVSLQPQHPQALWLAGTSALGAGRAEEAARHLETLVRLQPGMADAHHALGKARQTQGRMDDAEACFRKVLALAGTHAPAQAALGAVLAARGEGDKALALLQRSVAADAGNPEAHFHLGLVLQQQNRVAEAIDAFEHAVRLMPGNPVLLGMLARLLVVDHRYTRALGVARQWAQVEPKRADPLALCGVSAMNLQQVEDARAFFERGAELEPDNPGVRVGLCNVYRLQGDFQKAFAYIEPLLGADPLEIRVVKTYAALADSIGRTEHAVELATRALADGNMNAYDHRALCFLAGGLYDKLGDYDRAFELYREGNSPAGGRYAPEAFDDLVERTLRVFDTPGFPDLPRAAFHTDRPVLIVGMPRSGTSLVEQILASHPRVGGAGEVPDIMNLRGVLDRMAPGGKGYPECLPGCSAEQLDEFAHAYDDTLAQVAPEAARVTDKMPHNFLYLGLVNLMLPEARVIHIRRDPVDTCLSNYFQDFASDFLAYSNDLTHLGRHYRQYERLMEHWRKVLDMPFLEVQYEELVADQERVSREMIGFIGLEWDDACLSFHDTRRTVSTASYAQVRNPIYHQSVQRWRRYEKHLGPLLEALGITV